MPEHRLQFSARSIVFTVVVFAFLMSSFFFPMGYAIYLPIFGMLTLLWISVVQFRSGVRSGHRLGVREFTKLILPTFFLLALTISFFSFLGVINRQRAVATRIEEIERVAMSIENPAEFREAALRLHAKMTAGEIPLRLVESDGRIPPALGEVEPKTISADEDGLHVVLSERFGSVHAFVDEKRQFGDVQLCPVLYFWRREAFR